MYYTISYAAQFPAFADTKKGLLTCIQDTAEGMASVNSRKLEQLSSSTNEVVLDRHSTWIWIGEIKVLWMPWSINNDKESL
jgi:hypothetical protein